MTNELADHGVGVVIPVYNRSRILRETLPHVLAQTLPPARLVIVDDGSQDDSAAAAERWLLARRPPFAWRVIRAPRRTAAAARNTGFAEIERLPYVAFLDSDDHWPRDFLHRTVSRLAACPEALAVSADRLFYDAGGHQWGDDGPPLDDDPTAWLFRHDAGIASCSVLRTEAVRRAGGWSETMESGEDFELFLTVMKMGRWLRAPGPPVRFNRASDESHGEERNLSRRRVEMFREWALQHERAYAALDPRDPRRRRLLREAVATKWRNAARELLRHGRGDEAAAAFAAALAWSPADLRVRVRWLWARLAARWATARRENRKAPRGKAA